MREYMTNEEIIRMYLGKKVDLVCKDGEKFSGYVFEVYDEEDSDIGCRSVEIAPIGAMHTVEIAIEDIAEMEIDPRFREFDFRH